MDNFINKNKFLQFQLWKDCNIGCTFCCNKNQKDLNKIQSLNFVLKTIDLQQNKEFNQIGFIGGQFFSGQLNNLNVKKLFYKLFEKISKKQYTKIYITTALIYDMDIYLIQFLNYLRQLNILNKVLLCTSYDFKYRFKNEKMQQLWKNNMLKLHNLFPELRLHTQIIVTQHFINAVLNNKFSISQFRNKYNTCIDYIEPSSGFFYIDKQQCQKYNPGFFPTKQSYIQFLIKTAVINKQIDLKTFLSLQLRSSKLYYIDSGIRMLVDSRRQTKGVAHPLDKSKKYQFGCIDSQIKMIDLAKQVLYYI